MIKALCLTLFILVSILSGFSANAGEPENLLMAYPDFLESFENNAIIWKDGTKMPFDDGISGKPFDRLLDEPDLEDQLSMSYPIGKDYPLPIPENHDPGRIRYQPFFTRMYGSTASEVREKLVPIVWMPGTVNRTIYITSVNDVHEKLQAISHELDELPRDLKKYVSKTAGTFNWRVIAGTNRLSAHSFGIAIDINVDYSNYWRWTPDFEKNPQYKNQIPMEIVAIFEKHGFIWGGKWFHYDTMHFEYRPELLID